MDAVLDALRAQHRELRGFVDELGETGLLQPSRCDGWTVADVLLHLAQTDELARASVEGRFDEVVDLVAAALPATGDVDAWAGALVDHERSSPAASLARWEAAAPAMVAALATCAPGDRVPWVAGDLAARTLATTRLAEAWIHTGDVAHALRTRPAATDRLWHIARLAWRTVPYALAGGGHQARGEVAFVLEAPDGTTWAFGDPGTAATTVTGPALDLCEVAGRRVAADETALTADGPDAEAVLRLVRTFA